MAAKRYTFTVAVQSNIEFDTPAAAYAQISAAIFHHLRTAGVPAVVLPAPELDITGEEKAEDATPVLPLQNVREIR